MSLDLKPEKVKPYLKLLTEATVHLDSNKGSLRKDIWDYLNKKYTKSIDYRDFLLAIRKFLLEGKLINNEGFYHMHHEVIEEVREKTPTPVFRKTSEGKPIDGNMFLKFLKGSNGGVGGSGSGINVLGAVDGNDAGDSSLGSKKKGGSKHASIFTGSKISNSGKKQKVKPNKESTRQSTIQKYFMKRQIKQCDFKDFQKISSDLQTKKLGFATPAPLNDQNLKAYLLDHQLDDKQTPIKGKEASSKKRLGIHQKQRDIQSKNQLRRKILDQNINEQSKRITKHKKYLNNQKYSSLVVDGKKQQTQHQHHQQSSNQAKKSPAVNLISQKQTSNKDLFYEPVQLDINRKKQQHHIQPSPVKDDTEKKNYQDQHDNKYKAKFVGQGSKKQDLKEKKEKLIKKSNTKLTGDIIKELKKAVQRKNLVHRNKLRDFKVSRKPESIINEESKAGDKRKFKLHKKISFKSKAISKTHRKIRALKQLKSNLQGSQRVINRRLRGKTLDLTQLGIIKKKKSDDTNVKQEERGRPKQVSEDLIQQKSRSKSTSKIQKREKSRQKSASKQKLVKKRPYVRSVKAEAKIIQPKVKKIAPKLISKAKQQKIPKAIKQRKIQKLQSPQYIDYDRKAKLDAVKALKWLFSKHKDAYYVDEKLIYV